MKAAIALVCIVGCDGAFDLEKVTYVPPDAGPMFPGRLVNDPTGDYDEDGLPNESDPCVLIDQTVNGGRDDTDGDGVGDLCDPNLTTPGDCLVLFDSFASTLSPHWKFDGEMVEVDNAGFLHIPVGDETLVYLDIPLDLAAVYVTGYIHIGANIGGGGRFALQTFVDVMRTPAVNGRACSVESDVTSSILAIQQVTGGSDSPLATTPVGGNLVTAGTNATLQWTSNGCYGELDNGVAQDATIATGPPPGGIFGIRTLSIGFNVYVVAGYGRGCG